MFKFNKNAELLDTIEKQKGQLQRYESRLRDLVSAYKSLQNEKQALEASVKALTSSHSSSPSLSRKIKSPVTLKLAVSSPGSSRRESVDSSCKKENNEDSLEAEEDADEGANDDEIRGENSEEKQEDEAGDEDETSSRESLDQEKDVLIERLRHQISTLTFSLSTVSEEKSKIVATYQAERKKLKQDTELHVTEINQEVEELRLKVKELDEELSKSKEKVRTQQEDREQEQSTHSLMLRELQKMLNDERMKNEQISNDVLEARKAAQRAESGVRRSEDSEKRIKKLTEELETLTEKLTLAKEEAKKPSPLVAKLQKEIAGIKAANRIQVEKESLRANAAEESFRQVTMEGEERVSSLENQITELSNQMGAYESNKTKDQMTIQKLKERIAQVEAENGILAKQVAAASRRSESEDEGMMNAEGIKNQIVRYKGLLKIALKNSDESIDVNAWLATLDSQTDEDDYQKLYLEVQQELRQLKDEFERYKLRAQNVLKNKKEISGRESISIASSQRQVEELKAEIEEIKERHFHLRSHCDGLEERERKLVKAHEEEMMRMHLDLQRQLETLKEEYGVKTAELEHEMRSQRERTVALLAEKDKEIQHLQAYSKACHREYQTEYDLPDRQRLSSTKSGDYTFYGTEDSSKDPTMDSVSEIMSKGLGHDTTMIHYAEQMARKDVSINGLRRHKKQLELQIRQLQDAIIMKDEKNSREVAALEEMVAHFKRNKSRENANLEYLKNVMFQYLTTNRDQSARQRMLQAVIAILEFSPEETRKVLRSK